MHIFLLKKEFVCINTHGRYMTEIMSIWRETPNNRSINPNSRHGRQQNCRFKKYKTCNKHV